MFVVNSLNPVLSLLSGGRLGFSDGQVSIKCRTSHEGLRQVLGSIARSLISHGGAGRDSPVSLLQFVSSEGALAKGPLDKYCLAPFKQSSVLGMFNKDGLGAVKSGICRGLCFVWIRLHEANRDVTPSERMQCLSSEAAVIHAVIAQRLHITETMGNSFFMGGNRVFGKSEDQPELEVYSLKAEKVPVLGEDLFRRKGQEDTYRLMDERLEKRLSQQAGYYSIGLRLKGGTSVGVSESLFGSHDIGVFSEGQGRPLLVFDPNIGECLVPKQEFHAFLEEVTRVYEAACKMRIFKIEFVDRIRFLADFASTPLGHL
jgi:hypothetical protein